MAFYPRKGFNTGVVDASTASTFQNREDSPIQGFTRGSQELSPTHCGPTEANSNGVKNSRRSPPKARSGHQIGPASRDMSDDGDFQERGSGVEDAFAFRKSADNTRKSASRPKTGHKTGTGDDPAPDDAPTDNEGNIFAADRAVVAIQNTLAHRAKRSLGYGHDDVPDPSGKGIVKHRRVLAKDDPENHAIKNLRENARLSWKDIATIMNKERVKIGGAPDFTASAVYSRFVRNASMIASQQNQGNFDVKDHTRIRTKEMVESDDGSLTEAEPKKPRTWSRKADEILISSYKATKEEFWITVAEKFELQSGHKVSPTECAKRFKLI